MVSKDHLPGGTAQAECHGLTGHAAPGIKLLDNRQLDPRSFGCPLSVIGLPACLTPICKMVAPVTLSFTDCTIGEYENSSVQSISSGSVTVINPSDNAIVMILPPVLSGF